MPKNLKKTPYPLSAKARQDLKTQVDTLLRLEPIDRSRPPYVSETFCTYKGSKPKPVHDYRVIKGYLAIPAYPIPNMSRLIRTLRGAKFFTSIDIKDACFCLKLTEDRRKNTAFVTEDDPFEYNVGSFGLASMPAEFQSRIDKLMT